jgi:3-oxoacyl-[acyl-carrier-protein] synthase-1
MSLNVHVVAVSARTPLGLSAESSAAAARAGIQRLREHDFLIDTRGNPVTMGFDSVLAPELSGVERIAALARAALEELSRKLGAALGGRWNQRLPLLLGLPEPRPGWTPANAAWVCSELSGMKSPGAGCLVRRPLLLGHAAALVGIRDTLKEISRQTSPLVVVGGADSYVSAETLEHLEKRRQLMVPGARNGFVPGEGAAFLALASAEVVRSMRLTSLGIVRAAHVAQERHLILTDAVHTGEGLAEAVRGCLASANVANAPVDGLYCDINGERYRSEELGFVALRLPTAFRDPSTYIALTSNWGDMGAASGALSLMMAVQAGVRHYARGPLSMVCTSSEGGTRAAALFERARSSA